MNLIKIFKYGLKGSRKIKRAKAKGAAAAAAAAWPEGIKVGVFGHENAGKTVFFTALYMKSKATKDFSISVRDSATGNEFFKNEMGIKGVSVDRAGEGTIAAKAVPRKFPDPTAAGLVLQFTAILGGKKKIPVVTYDYSGKTASISEHSDEAEKMRDFMAEADGLLFFFDPKILGADPEVQARATAFVNILEHIVPLKSRLPIPVGLVITKADTLPGFDGEAKTVLIRAEDEQVIADDFDTFLEKVLGLESLSDNREWASSVRNILVKLREFIRVVVGRTLDFQVFFVSSTGSKPEKTGVAVGRSTYAPPDKFNPSGVTEPFHWILDSIVRSQKLAVLRKIAGCVAAAAIAWIVLYSLPFVFHFGGLLRSPYRLENVALKAAGGDHASMSEKNRYEIGKAYDRYGNRWLVRRMFPEYRLTAQRMRSVYGGSIGPEVARLDSIITVMTDVISDPAARPAYDEGDRKLILGDVHESLLRSLGEIHTGDESSVLYVRSGRVLASWKLFEDYLTKPGDPAVKDDIVNTANFNLQNAQNYSESERRLNNALVQLVTKESTGQSAAAASSGLGDYDQLKEQINGSRSTDPTFVLDEAATKLRGIQSSLAAVLSEAQRSAIRSFLSEVDEWKQKRVYACKLQAVPADCHLHVEVTDSGEDASWSDVGTQLMQGDKFELKWKPGDDIHLAFDERGFSCNWGNPSSDKAVFEDTYALFELEGKVTFPNIGKTVVISFPDGLKDKLPKLK